ncbi:hypothetical protein C8R48DRAFT_765007 [Suillus tomentosus]|nr:hypothetical protein C8R48DRAFT_765007 [Suillus tomentosus]
MSQRRDDVMLPDSFLDLHATGESGLVLGDVQNVDKQDDGAAFRLFNYMALSATTVPVDEGHKIHEGFDGLFVYLFIFGSLFDAWLSRTISNEDCILTAVRARFFLHLWRSHIMTLASLFPDLYSIRRSFISPEIFNIFNRLCDTLILLVLAYARFYPDQPFCIWMFGTHFVEHFFGISQKLLPNYAYTKLLKIVQHIMLRQRLLMSGQFNEKREKLSQVGYIIEYSSSPLSPHEKHNLLVTCTRPKTADRTPISDNNDDINSDSSVDTDSGGNNNLDDDDALPLLDSITGEAISRAVTQSTMRYAALCEDYDRVIADIPSSGPTRTSLAECVALEDLKMAGAASHVEPVLAMAKSALFDDSGKLSIACILNAHKSHQSETKVHSERVITIDPKFALHSLKSKLSITREYSHRLAVMQKLDVDFKNPTKAREERWKAVVGALPKGVMKGLPYIASKNVHTLHPLCHSSFVIIRNEKRMYIGEVLNLYKKGKNWHGSVPSSSNSAELSYLSLRVYHALDSDIQLGASDDDNNENSSDGTNLPMFSRSLKTFKLHTHAPIQQLIYHLNGNPFAQQLHNHLTLTAEAGARWATLSRPSVKCVILKLLPTIKIPARGARETEK